MRGYNSTIKRKKCKCRKDCDKYPTIGYKGYYVSHLPEEKKTIKKIDTKTKSKLKSDYIKIADILFGKFIKERDSDSNKNITCVCCRKVYSLSDKDAEGKAIVQALHFVPRSIYQLRYSEVNVHAGCSYCNLDMHINPDGVAYKRYRQFLVDCLGEEEVSSMESQKHVVSKLTESTLIQLIEKYTKKK
jgi:hypothetical protein